jgi:hypothetical protein
MSVLTSARTWWPASFICSKVRSGNKFPTCRDFADGSTPEYMHVGFSSSLDSVGLWITYGLPMSQVHSNRLGMTLTSSQPLQTRVPAAHPAHSDTAATSYGSCVSACLSRSDPVQHVDDVVRELTEHHGMNSLTELLNFR